MLGLNRAVAAGRMGRAGKGGMVVGVATVVAAGAGIMAGPECRAGVVDTYSTLGPGATSSQTHFWNSLALSGSALAEEFAWGFQAGRSGALVSLRAAVNQEQWPMQPVHRGIVLSLYAGESGVPGALLATASVAAPRFNNTTSGATLEVAMSGPRLEAGRTYFVAVRSAPVEDEWTWWLSPLAPSPTGPGFRRTVTSGGNQLFGAWNEVTPSMPMPAVSVQVDACGTSDFNGDGDFGTDQDIEAFFACLSGQCCGTCFAGGSDFNGDGDFGTDQDIEAFFRVLAGGAC
jgi:hypothetical protein